MSIENDNILIGYSASTRRYLLQIAIGSTIFCLFLLIWLEKPSAVPLLFVAACLTGELWWTTRQTLRLIPEGLLYCGKEIPWSTITRYTKWGPFGIPLTPFKVQGVTLYLKDGTSWCISSKAIAFDRLLRQLEQLTYPPAPEPLWHHYPPLVMRAIRYILSVIISILFLLILAADFLLILGGVILVYFIVRSYIQSHRKGAQTLSQDAWIAGSVSLILLCVLYFIFESPYLLLTIALIPMGIILWFPWQPASVALIGDTLFVGKKRAYPLRHLRTNMTISKFFLFKFWQLIFSNGEVLIMPTLENFEAFKTKLESQLQEVQRRYVGKKMSDDEAEIRTPAEEARRIHFFEADKIPLGMPVTSQFLIPLLVILHLSLIFSLIWLVYLTPVGRLGWCGIFLQSITPFFAVVYSGYILFTLIPRLSYLYSHADIDDNGIQTSTNRITWEQIHSIVLYQSASNQKRLALLDNDGKQLFQIRDEIADWEIATSKIRQKVQEIHKNSPVMSGASELLQKRSKAWQNTQRWLLLFVLVLLLPFTINNIAQHQQELCSEINLPAPLDQGYLAVHYFQHDKHNNPFVMSWLIGKRLLMIPYEDYQGETWYTFAAPIVEPNQLKYDNIRIRYLPDSPGYALPYGDVIDARLGVLNWLEQRGFTPENWGSAKSVLLNSRYVFWSLAILLLLWALIRQDLLAGLLMQRMPAPLGPELYLSGTIILQNTLRLVVHLLIMLFLGLLAFSLYWPDDNVFCLRIPITGLATACLILLPVLLCAYLSFYITIAIPQWIRGFKTWQINPDGIEDSHTQLKWEDIRSISVFEMPTIFRRWFKLPPRRIALIQGETNYIVLEGDLIHFDGIVAHIRKQTHIETNNLSKAKYFNRRRYARLQFLRVLTAIAMFWCLSWSFHWFVQYQNEVQIKGIPQQAIVNYSLLNTCALISYQDKDQQTWYNLVWMHESATQFDIYYHPDHPVLWDSNDKRISTLSHMTQSITSKFSDFFDKNQENIAQILDYLWYGVYLLLAIPLLWALMGATLGIPPREPKPIATPTPPAVTPPKIN